MTVSSAWYVKIVSSGLKKATSESGSNINFRANSFSDATMEFNDSSGAVTNVFTEESEVQIYIGDPDTTGVKMMHGYIISINTSMSPRKERIIQLYIIDWGSYLAAKRLFEKRYFATVTPTTVFNDTLTSVTDGTDTLTGTNIAVIAGDIKQFFEGTNVKDVWNQVAETSKVDYFVDESLDLNVFTVGSKYLTTSGSTYKLLDTVVNFSNEIMIRHDFPYEFTSDISQKIKNVTITNGLMQTFPDASMLNAFQVDIYHSDVYGKDFSKYYQASANSEYDVSTIGNTINPISQISDDQIGTQTIPSIKLNMASTATVCRVYVISHNSDGTVSNFNLTANDWDEIGFYIKNALTGLTAFHVYLYDDPSNYWRINIFPYLSTSWKYHRLSLPSTTSNSEVYTGGNWEKTGSPTKINYIAFQGTPNTGYTAGTGIYFAQLHLYTLRKKTVTSAGNPATEKIIIDGTQTHPDQLQTFATSEQARLNVTSKQATCTFTGNTDFKKPGYLIDVDFTTTLGTNRSGTGASGLRIESIRHFLQSGFHFTTVNLNNSFHRQ